MHTTLLLLILSTLSKFTHESPTSFPQASQNVFDQLSTHSEVAKIAYCTINPFFGPGHLDQTCSSMKYCLDHDTTEITRVFKPTWYSGDLSGTGFVAVDEVIKEVYVVFRGSCSPGDWITDISAVQSSYMPVSMSVKGKGTVADELKDEFQQMVNMERYAVEVNGTVGVKDLKKVVTNIDKKLASLGQRKVCKNCKTHFGVYLAHSRLFPDVMNEVKPYLGKGYNLTVTGHSLGGGYAQLAGAEFQHLGYNPRVITYGQLRVGNPEMNEFTDALFKTKEIAKDIEKGKPLPHGSLSRVYQTSDLVPQLPPFKKYTHAGLSFAITQIALPQTKANLEFRGSTDNRKNEVFKARWEDIKTYFVVYQHINYFTRLSFPCNDVPLLSPDDAWRWTSHEVSVV